VTSVGFYGNSLSVKRRTRIPFFYPNAGWGRAAAAELRQDAAATKTVGWLGSGCPSRLDIYDRK